MRGINEVRAFNIPVDDMDRASQFYKIVFGWDSNFIPGSGGNYHSLMMTPIHRGAIEQDPIAGGLYARGTNGLGQVFLEITVSSIEQSIQKVCSSGGYLVREKKPMLDFAYFAVVADTEGNLLGLWEDCPGLGELTLKQN
jgi:predicted enzyme related to lactoylglutathione lyase